MKRKYTTKQTPFSKQVVNVSLTQMASSPVTAYPAAQMSAVLKASKVPNKVINEICFDPQFPVHAVSATETYQPRLEADIITEKYGFRVSEENLETLEVGMRQGNTQNVAIVLHNESEGVFSVVDGNHRSAVCIDLGIESFPAIVLPASMPKNVVEAIARNANSGHGAGNSREGRVIHALRDMKELGITFDQAAAIHRVKKSTLETRAAVAEIDTRFAEMGLSNARKLPQATKIQLNRIKDSQILREAVTAVTSCALTAADTNTFVTEIMKANTGAKKRRVIKRWVESRGSQAGQRTERRSQAITALTNSQSTLRTALNRVPSLSNKGDLEEACRLTSELVDIAAEAKMLANARLNALKDGEL